MRMSLFLGYDDLDEKKDTQVWFQEVNKPVRGLFLSVTRVSRCVFEVFEVFQSSVISHLSVLLRAAASAHTRRLFYTTIRPTFGEERLPVHL